MKHQKCCAGLPVSRVVFQGSFCLQTNGEKGERKVTNAVGRSEGWQRAITGEKSVMDCTDAGFLAARASATVQPML